MRHFADAALATAALCFLRFVPSSGKWLLAKPGLDDCEQKAQERHSSYLTRV